MKLYLMQIGLYAHGDNRAPFAAYLIQTDDGNNILVDTGLDDAYVARQADIFRQDDETIIAHLHRLNLTPADIDYVICTHFDEDHCGGNHLFTQAELIVQQSHYELAQSGQMERFEICRACWDVPALNYRRITGDLELLPDIHLLVTDGHVPGHQSVLVKLPNTGAVLLASDAMRSGDMLLPGVDPRAASMFDMDGDKLIAGVRKLQAVIEREQVQLTVFGHDWTRWQPLRKSPAFYD